MKTLMRLLPGAASSFEDILRGDVDPFVKREVNGATLFVAIVHPLYRVPDRRRCLEAVDHVDATNHQDVLFFADITGNLGGQPAVRCIYLTRFQRASEGPRQSAAGRCHHVVEGGRMRFADLIRLQPIVLGNRSMDTEFDRFRFRREIG